MAEEDTCLELRPAQLAELQNQGWTIVGGPYDTEAECLANCSAAWYCMEDPTDVVPEPGNYVDGNFVSTSPSHPLDINDSVRRSTFRFTWGVTRMWVTYTGFTENIPVAATITGIRVTARVYTKDNVYTIDMSDSEVAFYKGSFVYGSSVAKPGTYPQGVISGAEQRLYEADETLTGLAPLSPALINDQQFGMRFEVVWNNPTPLIAFPNTAEAVVMIDGVRIYYDP